LEKAMKNSVPLRAGFTLIELLVVIAIIGVLASLLLPVLGRAKQKGQGIACLNNLRQLQNAWFLYTQDHEDKVPRNMSNHISAGKTPGNPNWVAGLIDFTPDNPDNTNTIYLTTGEYGRIGGYLQTAAVFKCPGDKSMARFGDRKLPRVRSYSLNGWCGLDASNFEAPIQVVSRLAQIVNPGPAKMWILADTHEDSINVGGFFVQGWSVLIDGEYIWSPEGLPAARHGGSGVFSFADGHAELRRWKDPRTLFDVQEKYRGSIWHPGNQDLYWLADHATQKNPNYREE
jgi:prepilin-type N-terminal cleavage/methylation domain-containing protein/prepilin-type processing-associated H-X9-DG protein